MIGEQNRHGWLCLRFGNAKKNANCQFTLHDKQFLATIGPT
jgi:hypothetical protein